MADRYELRTGRFGQYFYDCKTGEDIDLQTALSIMNAPEVVTLSEFWAGYDKNRHKYAHAILYVRAEFPNGLKITAAPNGGA